MRVREALLTAAMAAVAIGAGVLPGGPEPSGGAPPRPFLEGAAIDGGTRAMLQRSCGNCHSESARWPWYSHVPPVSWLIHHDVAAARARLNFSRWKQYTPAEQQALLSAIGGAARTGAMPPGRYTALHRGDRLSAEQRETLYRWTRAERARLRESGD